MLQRIFYFDEIPEHLDATDSLAVALCHAYQNDLPVSMSEPQKPKGKRTVSWAAFINQNPERVK